MDEHFRSVLSTGAGDIVRFISAQAFSGRKPGYFFKMGSKGLGYYYDPQQKDALFNQKPSTSDGTEVFDDRKRRRIEGDEYEENDAIGTLYILHHVTLKILVSFIIL